MYIKKINVSLKENRENISPRIQNGKRQKTEDPS